MTALAWASDADLTARGWQARLSSDGASAGRLVPDSVQPLHRAVVARARDADARGLVLTGSTARGRRTEVSDLDYHLVGESIDTRDLSAELDLHVLSAEELTAALLAGDDFIQWSIRFGLVLFDDGTLHEAARLIVEERLWPDVVRKAEHAETSLNLARRVVASGDADGALIQVRTALSLAARAYLLALGEFPLSRAELPEQLAAAGRVSSATALRTCIVGAPSLPELDEAVTEGYALLETGSALASGSKPRSGATHSLRA